jgi:pseudouridine synthase
VDATNDHITVDRRPIPRGTRSVYIMLNKPKGCVSTARDPEGRRTVLSLVDVKQRVFPVGRLDYDSTGLLILTNDGEFAQRILHPRYHVPRVYFVRVRGDVPPIVLGRLRKGVELDDGVTRPARVEIVEHAFNTTVLRMTLQEGKTRQIRRMCEAVSHPVLDLHRAAMGPLRLGDLGAGKWRFLSAREVEALSEAASRKPGRPAPRPPEPAGEPPGEAHS